MGARWYSPWLGRFLSPDPIGDADGPNLYAYVGNDPINLTDPTGMFGEAAGGFGSSSNNAWVGASRALNDSIRGGRSQSGGTQTAFCIPCIPPAAYWVAGGGLATLGVLGASNVASDHDITGGASGFPSRNANGNGSRGASRPTPGPDTYGTPPGGPNDPRFGGLSRSQLQAVNSLESRAREHEEKLRAYRANPNAFDNKGYLRNAPNQQVRNNIIQGRIKGLETEIRGFRQQAEAIRRKGGM